MFEVLHVPVDVHGMGRQPSLADVIADVIAWEAGTPGWERADTPRE